MSIYFADGKAFLEVAENYLLYIGDKKFIRDLDPDELWALVHATVLAIKYGEKQMPCVLPTSKLVH